MRELIVFCDESEKNGAWYSNFYGGLMIASEDYLRVEQAIKEEKRRLNFHGEVKWSKVTEKYEAKYRELVAFFFNYLRSGHIKLRIQFRANAQSTAHLSSHSAELEYFKLYYQFIKHGLDLPLMPICPEPVGLRLYFDRFPDTHEKSTQFKGYLLGLGASPLFREKNLVLYKENIAEVRSHDHALIQCLDVVMGAIAFRLNDKHKAVRPDTRRRGSRTKAKERLYRAILAEIRLIHPNFNIGITTRGKAAGFETAWQDPYRHWNFKPGDAVFDNFKTKARASKGKDPIRPT